MKKKVFIVFECGMWGGNPSAVGVFDTLDSAITSIIDNCGYSEEEMNCVRDMRQYIAEHRYTPDLRCNYSIQEYVLNEWS